MAAGMRSLQGQRSADYYIIMRIIAADEQNLIIDRKWKRGEIAKTQ